MVFQAHDIVSRAEAVAKLDRHVTGLGKERTGEGSTAWTIAVAPDVGYGCA